MQIKLALIAIAAILISTPLPDRGAFAQTPPAEQTAKPAAAKPAPGARTRDHVRPSAHTARLYECRARTRKQGFGFNFVKRNRFMRACMAGRV
jgi:hypothetical protein